jgi:hypothetical protein
MTDKAEKFGGLWADYAQARAGRRNLMAKDLPETAESFADLALADGGAEQVAEHLDALSAERRSLKKLSKYLRKHGAEMRPAAGPTVSEPAASRKAKALTAKPRKPRATSGSAGLAGRPMAARASKPPSASSDEGAAPARKSEGRGKPSVSTVAATAEDRQAAPPARPRRPRTSAAIVRKRAPAGTPKA